MATKTKLRAKKPLKAKTAIKQKADKPKKHKTPEITLLKRKADKLFSRYVRIRDSRWEKDGWYGKCITCSKQGKIAWLDGNKLRMVAGWDAGHYISRGNWYLRFEEMNVNLQCKYHCNKWKSGNIEKYKTEIDLKYGDGIRLELDSLAQKNKNYTPSKERLREIIHDSDEQIRFYVKSIDNNPNL